MRFVVILLAVLLDGGGSVSQSTRVAGSSVSLTPPTGFSTSARFAGFERADLQASIMVTELPAPFAGITRGMTASGLASRGMTLLASKRMTVDGREALLVHASQQANGADVLKWLLISGDAKASVMIVATFPRSAEAELSDAVRASLLTARWNSATTAAPDPFEGLAFRVTPTRTLKIAGRVNNLLTLTESGSMTQQSVSAAMLFVGTSLAPVKLDDLAGYAEARALKTAQLKGLRISQRASITIDGASGHELVAEGSDVKTGRAVTLYQVMAPEGDGYVLIQGLVASSRAAVMVPEFRQVAQSYRRQR